MRMLFCTRVLAGLGPRFRKRFLCACNDAVTFNEDSVLSPADAPKYGLVLSLHNLENRSPHFSIANGKSWLSAKGKDVDG
jgi:hypothetical protein